MARGQTWLGVFLVAVPFAFVACGDDEDDGGGSGDGGGKGGSGAADGGDAGTVTGGTTTGGTTTGGRGGSGGRGGTSGTSGASTGGEDMGGFGGEDGGFGGEPQGGTAGMAGKAGAGGGGAGGAAAGMAGKAGAGGAGAGGGGAGGIAGAGLAGAGGAGAGGVGGAGAGGAGAGGVGGAGAGGVGGAGAGGAGAGGVGGAGAGAGGAGNGGAGMAGMAGMAGTGGTAPTCDPTPAPEVYVGVLEGGQEVPPVITAGTGFVVAELNTGATQLTSSVYWSGMTSLTTLGHIHGPAQVGVGGAPPIFNYNPPTTANSGQVVGATFAIDAPQLAQLRAGLLYANIHSSMNPGGELRAQLVQATVFRSGPMSGAQEVPPVTSSGTGRGVVAVFPNGMHASVSVTWSGLTTGTHLGHIHGPAPAGTGAGVLFNLEPVLGNTSGSVIHKIWTFTGAHSANLLGNLTYANIHSTMYMGGELRGQLLPPCP